MDKKGIELAVDRLEALRVRIDACARRDQRAEVSYEHWLQLCREALTEVLSWQRVVEVVTANLALSRDADPEAVAQAVRICVRRLEELEVKLTPPVESKDPLRDWQLAQALPKLPTRHDDEQRIDSIENAMLAAWLDDAQRKLRTSAVYMVAHEARFSEDMFDELRLLADKIEEWSLSIRQGDRFP